MGSRSSRGPAGPGRTPHAFPTPVVPAILPVMNPYFTKEHNELRERVHAFALSDIAPVARELDEQSRFPWENVKKMADMGLFGVNVPKEYGGQGLDVVSYMSVIEELAGGDGSHSITISAHSTLGLSPILNFGTEAQK